MADNPESRTSGGQIHWREWDGFGDHSVFYYSIDPDIGQKNQISLDEETIRPVNRWFLATSLDVMPLVVKSVIAMPVPDQQLLIDNAEKALPY